MTLLKIAQRVERNQSKIEKERRRTKSDENKIYSYEVNSRLERVKIRVHIGKRKRVEPNACTMERKMFIRLSTTQNGCKYAGL